MRRTVIAALAAAVLMMCGAACGSGSSGSQGSEGSDGSLSSTGSEDQSSSDSGDSIDASAPQEEDTDSQEAPDQSGNEAVAVDLPGLPVGGDSTVESDTLQCASVNWSGPPDLPDEIAITLGSLTFDPSDQFSESSESCPDAPPCLGDFTLTNSSDGCSVAVAWNGPTNAENPTLSFGSGQITCEPARIADCHAFRDAVAESGPQSITIQPAPDQGTDETDGTDSGSGDDSGN